MLRQYLLSSITVLALSLTLACGGGDGDDAPDAGTAGGADAMMVGIDAMVNTTLMGLGQICDMANPCPMEAPTCALLSIGATSGVCTLTCATALPDAEQPDMAAHATCASAYTGATGTPQCALTTQSNGMPRDWACGVICGMSGMTDFGMCPSPLNCVANVCQP